ncbi:hypothetical protein P175DRAFT_077621 [Aspergillus ochraceoroseus IBT 24754]|uniref:Uncharacterized protein n=1 Tax=Aspergillus ochraceoroseus IBT 24754 TaxID=1392256 RepID=A0A2T5MA33_9EURO|nr:uncharacterized protein P175DRAFT_077621 [Aspergillus ochraceoroseus IBT 24754]PTU25394.1 hypothetical protein P175DRAFT_077621 [Aspergillus ochraceoroseus IBT 24754]
MLGRVFISSIFPPQLFLPVLTFFQSFVSKTPASFPAIQGSLLDQLARSYVVVSQAQSSRQHSRTNLIPGFPTFYIIQESQEPLPVVADPEFCADRNSPLNLDLAPNR